jgi:outer membrane receptor protein involved in Fe transport
MTAMIKTYQRNTLAIAISLATGLTALPSHAQMLEEVVVTATKRAVGMQDVPIALSVMDGSKIMEQGIGSLTDMAIFMPNVHISEASAGDQLFIRGVGSGVNYGFEQSVGTFIDGVYFGRGQASRSSFLDVERVEVLKGSQSTLFGKNTIAGAINITTAKPGDEFEGSIEGMYEPEFDSQNAILTLSGPITDTFGARFVVRAAKTDGWMDNRLLNEDEVSRDDTVGRLVLSWQPTADLDVTFKYESGESEATGGNEVITVTTPASQSFYETVDPNFASNSGFGYEKSAQTFGGQRQGDTYHDSKWDISTLTAEWALGEYTIKSITGYVDYQFDNYRDNDYGPLIATARGRDETHKQFTQEFLLTSPLGERFEYMAGLFYQDEELEHDKFTDVSLSNYFDAGVPLPPLVESGIGDATVLTTFGQDVTTYSAFFQGTFHFNDTLRTIVGIRYSEDEKEFDKDSFMVPLLTTGPESELLAAVYDGFLNLATQHTFGNGQGERCPGVTLTTVECVTAPLNTKREEDHVTGDITLQWDATDSTMLYAKWGNGYKAGGFDEDNTRGYFDVAEYEDETAETIEIGAKMDLWDGRGRLNVAVFHSGFDDVQVSTFDGNAGFVVGNAAETEVDGIELDGMMALTDELTLSFGLAYLDAAYKSFKDAGCTNDQTEDWVADGGVRNQCVQDLSGNRLQFAADWSGNFGLNYSTDISDNLGINASADLMYTDEFDTAADGDDVLVQDAYTKINARIELASLDGVWSVALLGKNLTDEETSNWGNDIPLAGFGFAGSYFQMLEAPRSYAIQARYSF